MNYKKNTHQTVVVNNLPECDFCKLDPLVIIQLAHYDGKTKTGPWAYMCEDCFSKFGVGLGLDKGQHLVLRNTTLGK